MQRPIRSWQTMRPAFLLAFLLSAIAADPYICQDETIVLDPDNPTFSLNDTQFDSQQDCTWNFTIPSNFMADTIINCTLMSVDDQVQLTSTWGGHKQLIKWQPLDFNNLTDGYAHVMWPPAWFVMTITTAKNTTMMLTINIVLRPLSVAGKVSRNFTTAVNQQPNFVQLRDWQVDTAIVAQAQDNGKLSLAISRPDGPGYPFCNIFVYEGAGDGLQFIGTLISLFTSAAYISTTDTLTFYRAMDDEVTGTLIVNDYENMKNVTKFHVQWSPYYRQDIYYQQTINIAATNGLAALTVLNEPDGSNAIYLTDIYNVVCKNQCPNYTSPVKLLAGGMIRDYDRQGTLLGTYRDFYDFDDRNYPQFLPGMARTFVVEEGSANIYYTSIVACTIESDPFDGRNGFVMSNNYPFMAADQNSQDFTLISMDGNDFTFEYTINDKKQKKAAYLYFSLNSENNFIVDLHNITAPAAFNLTAREMTMSIVGGNESSTGTFIPYKIYSTAEPPPTSNPNSPSRTCFLPPTLSTTDAETTVSWTVPSSTPSSATMASWKIALICLGVLLFIILIILLILFLRYRIRRGKYRKFWSTMSGVLPIAVKVDEWELGDKQLEIFEDKELGRGAFGIVYEGELYGDRPVDRIIRSVQKMTQEEKEQKKVAVKRLPLNADNQARLDFTEEISFMKKLGYHPHILGMIGCITVGTSTPSIVLDYCYNGDLLSWVRKNKYSTDMKPEQLLSIAWQISDGLCYLKSLNLIHRDLAGRNILLSGELVAKISDFGLCRKPENSEDSGAYLPQFYVSRGGRLPVKWLAPESLRDFQFSFKTDLWSYGVILWEMYTFGDVPFGDVNPLNLFELLDSGGRLPQGAIPDPIYDLMSGCWDAVPGKRTPIEKVNEILHEMLLTCSSNNYGYLTISADDGALQWAEEETANSDQYSQQSEEIEYNNFGSSL